MKKLLIIGMVWPEPSTTAAGVRMLEIIRLLSSKYTITFGCTAQKTDYSFDLSSLNIDEKEIELNNENFDQFIVELRPDAVLFDRFISEEQFGWRVSDTCPHALRILDTEDLHFIRRYREKIFKNKQSIEHSWLDTDLAKREIASIFRCDLSLIISQFEMEILINEVQLPHQILFFLPFLRQTLKKNEFKNYPSFEKRNGFMTIGNFKHEPNWQAVLRLKKSIWPKIRKVLPNTEIHIFGAYATDHHKAQHAPEEGFYIDGWVDETKNAFTPYRVCLAPLPFGAGLKGKIVDAFTFGTPVVTTPSGAEGINQESWDGFIANSDDEIINNAIMLHEDKELWNHAQEDGRICHNAQFEINKFDDFLLNRISNLHENLPKHRSKNFFGTLLSFHTMRSTKYMSKWIEEKNK